MGVLLGAVFLLSSGRAETEFRSGPRRVALIELFTSEGCSSCPPAEQWLGELRHDKGLWRDFIPVAFHVNYWDRLGWKDVLASKPFTDRQYAYVERWGTASVYTPCFVRDGEEWRPSGNPAVGRGKDTGASGELRAKWDIAGNKCRISYLPPASTASGAKTRPLAFEVSVALVGSEITHQIQNGENAGRRLRHDFVALRMETAKLEQTTGGEWTATVNLSPRTEVKAGRRAIAAWVSVPGERAPIQATGGWLD
jgi:hypothetical protein